jgi:hypothetical protein
MFAQRWPKLPAHGSQILHRCNLAALTTMRIGITLILSLLTAAGLIASPVRDPGLLLSFQRAQDLQSITAFHARIIRVRHFSTDGDYALQIDF